MFKLDRDAKIFVYSLITFLILSIMWALGETKLETPLMYASKKTVAICTLLMGLAIVSFSIKLVNRIQSYLEERGYFYTDTSYYLNKINLSFLLVLSLRQLIAFLQWLT